MRGALRAVAVALVAAGWAVAGARPSLPCLRRRRCGAGCRGLTLGAPRASACARPPRAQTARGRRAKTSTSCASSVSSLTARPPTLPTRAHCACGAASAHATAAALLRTCEATTRGNNVPRADLPGFTRSVYARDHALITPESHVFAGMPGWREGPAPRAAAVATATAALLVALAPVVTPSYSAPHAPRRPLAARDARRRKNALGAVLISPKAAGAHFTMTLLDMGALPSRDSRVRSPLPRSDLRRPARAQPPAPSPAARCQGSSGALRMVSHAAGCISKPQFPQPAAPAPTQFRHGDRRCRLRIGRRRAGDAAARWHICVLSRRHAAPVQLRRGRQGSHVRAAIQAADGRYRQAPRLCSRRGGRAGARPHAHRSAAPRMRAPRARRRTGWRATSR